MSHRFGEMLKNQRLRLGLLGLSSLTAIALGFVLIPPQVAVELVSAWGYHAVLVTVAIFGFFVVRATEWREVAGRWRSGGWKIVLLIFGVSVLPHLQEPHGFKVVNDEIVLLSTAQRMHQLRESNMALRGYPLGTNFVLFKGDVDKRPLLFPFLVATLHDFTGYRPENSFILNALLTPVLFGLLYLVCRNVSGVGGGVAGVLLFASVPLLTQTMAGGGFEVLNLVMILAVLYLGMRYAASPTSVRLSAFCLGGVLLAQVRYESVLFVVPVAFAVAYGWWKAKEVQLPWPLLIVPLLLVIYPLQFKAFELRPDLWQTADHFSEHGTFSLAYFYDNVGRALRYFFSFDRTHANSPLVGIAGVIGIGFFWMYLYRNYREIVRTDGPRTVAMIFLLGLFGQAVLMMCYFWGAYDEPITVRLSLPTQLLFVLAFVVIYPHLVAGRARWAGLSALVALSCMIWTMPVVAQRAYAHENLAAETSNWYRDYLYERPDRDFFVIEPGMPMFWVAHRVPSVPYEALAIRVEEFLYHYRQHTFPEILVAQKLGVADFSTGRLAPVEPHDLGDAVQLETVREIRFKATYAFRLSRVIAIDEARLREWAKRRLAYQEPQGSAGTDPSSEVQKAFFTHEWLNKLP